MRHTPGTDTQATARLSNDTLTGLGVTAGGRAHARIECMRGFAERPCAWQTHEAARKTDQALRSQAPWLHVMVLSAERRGGAAESQVGSARKPVRHPGNGPVERGLQADASASESVDSNTQAAPRRAVGTIAIVEQAGTPMGSVDPSPLYGPGITRHHDAGWDGSGYPDNLQRQAIPTSAPPAAVADRGNASGQHAPSRRHRAVGRPCGPSRADPAANVDPRLADALSDLQDDLASIAARLADA